jgi:hypothetical protein
MRRQTSRFIFRPLFPDCGWLIVFKTLAVTGSRTDSLCTLGCLFFVGTPRCLYSSSTFIDQTLCLTCEYIREGVLSWGSYFTYSRPHTRIRATTMKATVLAALRLGSPASPCEGSCWTYLVIPRDTQTMN